MERGLLIKPDALDFIIRHENPLEIAEKFLKNYRGGEFVIGLENIATMFEKGEGDELASGQDGAEGNMAQEHDSRGEVYPEKSSDITIICNYTEGVFSGGMEAFHGYFLKKFRLIKNVLKKRADMRDATQIKSLRDGRVVFIGMIYEIKRTKRGNYRAVMEDETGAITVIFDPVNGKELMEDVVVGIIGKKSGDVVFAEKVVWPLGRTTRKGRVRKGARVVLISDTHVGSVAFLEDSWKRFVGWIESNPVDYLIIAGDLVDGIGIYPEQVEDLDIVDIYGQYRELARLLSEIPERTKIILVPGNHDAVRPVEPQPPLSDAFMRFFDERVYALSNPSTVEIGGATITIYHGRSIDDLVGAVPGITYSNPDKAMKVMLRTRTFAPIYGKKTPLSPDGADYMFIHSTPDVLVTGHVHGFVMERYNGCLLVNASTWQGQTKYQKMRNIDPKPGIAVIYDTASGAYSFEKFF